MPHMRYTRSAESDLLELWLTIAEDNPVAADNVLDIIRDAVKALAAQPEMGKARSELYGGLRSFPTRTPYIIFYLAENEGVQVIRVLHHARNIDAEYFD